MENILKHTLTSKDLKYVSSMLMLGCTVVPVYMVVRFAMLSIMTPEHLRVAQAIFVWWEPIGTGTFRLIGWFSIIITVLYLVIYQRQNIRLEYGSQHKRPWLFALLGLLLWITVSTLVSGHAGEEWYGSAFRNDGLFSYLVYASVFVCTSALVNSKWKVFFLNLFSLLGCVTAIIVILQSFNIAAVLDIFPYVNASVFYNTNHCAYYLTMTILCIFGLYQYEERNSWRIIYLLAFAIQFFALVRNNTFGCFLAVWIGSIAEMILFRLKGRRRQLLYYLPHLVMLVLSACLSQTVMLNFMTLFGDMGDIVEQNDEMLYAGSSRLQLWINAVERIKENPIFGLGPEGLLYAYPDSPLNDRPHNEYLQCAVFFGIPGLVLYLTALFSLAAYQLKRIKSVEPVTMIAGGVVFAYLVSAFFGNTMFYTSPYFFIFLGIVAFSKDEVTGDITKKLEK